jgi:hypothetical protein
MAQGSSSKDDQMDSTILFFVGLSIMAIGTLGFQIAALRKKVSALSRIEAKLDMLLKQGGTSYDPFADLPPGVIEALRRGEKIEAIKRYREATGAGLKASKEFVEEVQRRAGLVA